MYHHPSPHASPNAIAADSKVRRLEEAGAPPEAIDAASDAYWEVIDAERREANRLNAATEAALAREAAEVRKIERAEFCRLQRQSEAAAAYREHTGNVNGFGT